VCLSLSVAPLLSSCLESVIGLAKRNEISGEFAFQAADLVVAWKAMPFTIAQNEGIRRLVERQTAVFPCRHRLPSEIVYA
jgi:hypothetical protein